MCSFYLSVFISTRNLTEKIAHSVHFSRLDVQSLKYSGNTSACRSLVAENLTFSRTSRSPRMYHGVLLCVGQSAWPQSSKPSPAQSSTPAARKRQRGSAPRNGPIRGHIPNSFVNSVIFQPARSKVEPCHRFSTHHRRRFCAARLPNTSLKRTKATSGRTWRASSRCHPTASSTASSAGSNSTNACSNLRRTRRSRSSNARASRRSSPAISTSSSWSASPVSSAASTPASP